MGKIEGKKEALEILNSLSSEKAESLLKVIKEKDPSMGDFLEDNLITLDDLKFLSTQQLVVFLQGVDLYKFGLALRGVSNETVQDILGRVSRGISLDIEDGLKSLKDAHEISKASAEILKSFQDKVNSGILVINKGDTLV